METVIFCASNIHSSYNTSKIKAIILKAYSIRWEFIAPRSGKVGGGLPGGREGEAFPLPPVISPLKINYR